MSTITKIPFGLGEPQVAGPLAVFPVLGPEPRTSYQALAQALRHGAFVTEVDEQGSVGDVRVGNPTGEPFLIYEGEEIEGARQNRSFESHVLVPAGVEFTVAVSCVEQGRWDHHNRVARFAPAAHTPDPELRRIKRTRSNRAASRGEAPRADQHEVWGEVSQRLSAHHVASASGALSDVFRAKGSSLEKLRAALRHEPNQLGAVVEISGNPVALDLTSRAEVFAELFPRLAQGYALQALEAAERAVNARAAYGFLTAALEAPRRWLPTPGIGDGFAISQAGVEGSGLTIGRELIAVSAFPAKKLSGA